MTEAAANIEPLWQSFIGGHWVDADRRLGV